MRVAVIPYRDRAPQLAKLIPALFARGIDRVVVCEQGPLLPFNRGLIKNLGVALGELDPRDTVYLHDVDLLPGPELRAYPLAQDDVVLHLYGHRHCLGGAVGMTYRTFQRVGGFPNDLWKWGGEDYALEQACTAAGVTVDRRWFRQRFTADGWFAEMDAKGAPMDGAFARRQFARQVSQADRKVTRREHYQPGYAVALSFLKTRLRVVSKADPRVMRVVVELKEG